MRSDGQKAFRIYAMLISVIAGISYAASTVISGFVSFGLHGFFPLFILIAVIQVAVYIYSAWVYYFRLMHEKKDHAQSSMQVESMEIDIYREKNMEEHKKKKHQRLKRGLIFASHVLFYAIALAGASFAGYQGLSFTLGQLGLSTIPVVVLCVLYIAFDVIHDGLEDLIEAGEISHIKLNLSVWVGVATGLAMGLVDCALLGIDFYHSIGGNLMIFIPLMVVLSLLTCAHAFLVKFATFGQQDVSPKGKMSLKHRVNHMFFRHRLWLRPIVVITEVVYAALCAYIIYRQFSGTLSALNVMTTAMMALSIVAALLHGLEMINPGMMSLLRLTDQEQASQSAVDLDLGGHRHGLHSKTFYNQNERKKTTGLLAKRQTIRPKNRPMDQGDDSEGESGGMLKHA